VTGRSKPTIAPQLRDQAPAAQITVLVRIEPWSVTTSVISAPLMLMSTTSQLTRISAPWARAANA
jgi:hypothetical protein